MSWIIIKIAMIPSIHVKSEEFRAGISRHEVRVIFEMIGDFYFMDHFRYVYSFIDVISSAKVYQIAASFFFLYKFINFLNLAKKLF
jgi:hypothetical protein